MSFTDKVMKKIMADPKVQFQMTLGLMDNLINNLDTCTKEVLAGGFSLDEYESKLYALQEACKCSLDVVYGALIQEEQYE